MGVIVVGDEMWLEILGMCELTTFLNERFLFWCRFSGRTSQEGGNELHWV